MTAITSTFESYLALAEKALHKSRKSVDTRALIQLAYGDETAHIGGNDMLMGILDSVLDKITNETVLEELKSYGTSNTEPKESEEKMNDENASLTRMTPQERLDKVDQATSYVIDWEERRDQIEDLDVKSARGLLHQNLLPEGVTMEDVVAYQEQQQRLQAKKTLQLELQRIEDEISALQNQNNEKENKIRKELGKVEKVERELQASANACAMVAS
mmetsp:Transcript_586/g.1303  ORF Transcript_586/g.1303 Transcript_586/m.1303 type:complete len:216 (-) Transcript_586:212-859(-)|eukprot:CAMPEP_0116098798 /NCGR_PEP_ID=MMETSP0327-20121206/11430_1 /TAXON_ID=44447 /ORGANISM="Pseudo-nitzschia delicatissima, Strain B596" /LENGTH=215 /DNA_ID=CAMNT_0003590639 /DNA_START=52 /DNA_END=699 /DNA_ORIENTATION=+